MVDGIAICHQNLYLLNINDGMSNEYKTKKLSYFLFLLRNICFTANTPEVYSCSQYLHTFFKSVARSLVLYVYCVHYCFFFLVLTMVLTVYFGIVSMNIPLVSLIFYLKLDCFMCLPYKLIFVNSMQDISLFYSMHYCLMRS